MKTAAAIAATLFAVAPVSSMTLTHESLLLSQFEAGERLSKGEYEIKTALQGFAFVTYVQGVVEGNTLSTLFCPPAEAKPTDIMPKVGARLRERAGISESSKGPAFGVVLRVAAEEWPCPGRAPR